ncbi:MAG: hypothetical protein R2705_08975 [Ilumatobacteraceae bacterium]
MAGVEEAADAVTSEVHQSERASLDALGEIVHCFGRSVADVRAMPGNDLWRPAGDGAAEPSKFGWHLSIGEITADLGNPFCGEDGVGVVVDLHDFLRVCVMVEVSGGVRSLFAGPAVVVLDDFDHVPDATELILMPALQHLSNRWISSPSVDPCLAISVRSRSSGSPAAAHSSADHAMRSDIGQPLGIRHIGLAARTRFTCIALTSHSSDTVASNANTGFQ